VSSITYEFKASYAFIERNYNIVKRYWAWELVWLVYGIVNSLSVSFIGVGMGALGATAVAEPEHGDLSRHRAPSCGAISR